MIINIATYLSAIAIITNVKAAMVLTIAATKVGEVSQA
jgi:Na+-transporting NADH:ubiquinone oxidoreductase subunit NqrD